MQPPPFTLVALISKKMVQIFNIHTEKKMNINKEELIKKLREMARERLPPKDRMR
jgi:hypothetical protein